MTASDRPAARPQPVLPGATIGILGSGQLGRMLAIDARRMGYRIHVYSPDQDSPAGQIADREWVGPYDDLSSVRAFAASCSVVTFEFENVPSATAAACAEVTLVRPNGALLHATQHRLREKTTLHAAGFAVTPFAHVRSLADLSRALESLGVPAVLKSAGWGYDGKGQAKILRHDDAPRAWESLGGAEAVAEAFVDFSMEISVVAARTVDGSFAAFDVCENSHAQHILDVTVVPARCSSEIARQAVAIAQRVLQTLDVVGVLCVEFFVTKGGELLINELAPRPHNSGHFTIDACVTSQFEQQLRAVCGLPLGSAALRRPAAAMANLLGDLWGEAGGTPDWSAALAMPDVKLHLYGKAQPCAGRKMGHLTALADTPAQAESMVRTARARLARRGS